MRQEHVFDRYLKMTERKYAPKLAEYGLKFLEIKKCCEEFVQPFVKKLDTFAMIYSWSLWDCKALTLSFFYQLSC